MGLVDDMTAARAVVTELEEQLNTLVGANNSHQRSIRSLTEVCESRLEEIDGLQEEARRLEVANADFRSVNSQLEDRNVKLASELAEARSARGSRGQASLNQLGDTIESLQHQLENAKSSVAIARNAAGMAEGRLRAMREDVRQLAAKIYG